MSEILYGLGNFADLRAGNGYFVDKTDKIAELERTRFAFFLRPRRFGKSLLASMLCNYYDLGGEEKFDALFKGTKIYSNPTPERSSYLVMYFNFSSVSSDSGLVQKSFDSCVNDNIEAFASAYSKILPDRALEIAAGTKNSTEKLTSLLASLRGFKNPVYIIIDEYDRFANTLLAESGQAAYDDLCHGDGFFKHFFSILKTESESFHSIVKRIFITGVSPLVMDDVTSGFNIGTNVSDYPSLAQIVGFSHADIREILDYYSAFKNFDKELAYETMVAWYDNYRFSEDQEEPVANTSQVLQHVQELMNKKRPPARPIDTNMKQDYAKIRHLVTLNNRLNGSFAKIESILEKAGTFCDFKESFQAKELAKPDIFVSLLYYFGLLTRSQDPEGFYNMTVPNATMRRMLGGIITDAYQEVLGIDPQLEKLAGALRLFSFDGNFQAVMAILADFVSKVFKLRDSIEGEKTVQAILATLLYAVNGPFLCHNEIELNEGYCDLALFPAMELGMRAEHAAILELKYVKKKEKVSKSRLAALKGEAGVQLDRYAEKLPAIAKAWKKGTGIDLAFHKYRLIFQGGKLLDWCEAPL